MATDLEFIYTNEFICPRCTSRDYDKMIYTGDKLLNQEDCIISERYVCRNCDLPVYIDKYTKKSSINITSDELLKESKNNEGE